MGHIRVTNLGKAYKRYASRRDRLLEWLDPRHKPRHESHWVLRNVNFEIQPGEAVGIIGKNGAGKSTLLKLITGTTQATEGTIEVSGRVAALLELGMGFHPEFTGRQNVLMAGQLLGFDVAEIEAQMNAIETFADIGPAIDDPVRTYSSGMQVRLAFAVATAIRPDILIVDEALAVGDAAFQRKCFRRIEEYLATGTTLLYVSHDIDGVKRLCTKAAYFHAGCMVSFGVSKHVCDQYEKDLFAGPAKSDALLAPVPAVLDPDLRSDCEVSYGDGRATIEEIWLENAAGQRCNVFGSGEEIKIRYRVRFRATVVPVFAFLVKTKEGIPLLGTDTGFLKRPASQVSVNQVVEVAFQFANIFSPGVYYLNCGVRDDGGDEVVFMHRRVDALIFRVRADAQLQVAAGLISTPISFEHLVA